MPPFYNDPGTKVLQKQRWLLSLKLELGCLMPYPLLCMQFVVWSSEATFQVLHFTKNSGALSAFFKMHRRSSFGFSSCKISCQESETIKRKLTFASQSSFSRMIPLLFFKVEASSKFFGNSFDFFYLPSKSSALLGADIEDVFGLYLTLFGKSHLSLI